MARILLCWELGGGLGHLIPLQQVALFFSKQGHEIWLICKETTRVKEVFDDLPINVLEAPQSINNGDLTPSAGFSDMLNKLCYGNINALHGLISVWRNMINLINPDILFIDHSPTALVASYDIKIPKVAIGITFSIPDSKGLFFQGNHALEKNISAEKNIVTTINSVYSMLDIGKIQSLSDIFEACDAYLFQTYEELDHYPGRNVHQKQKTTYVGTTTRRFKKSAQFPSSQGPKIFCYVTWNNQTPVLLSALHRLQCSAIIVARSFPADIIKKYKANHLLYTFQPVDMQQVLREANLGILSAGMNTTSLFLKSGIPVALCPLYIEQQILAKRVETLKAGTILNMNSFETTVEGLQEAYGQQQQICASIFSDKYKHFSPERALHNALTAIEKKFYGSL